MDLEAILCSVQLLSRLPPPPFYRGAVWQPFPRPWLPGRLPTFREFKFTLLFLLCLHCEHRYNGWCCFCRSSRSKTGHTIFNTYMYRIEEEAADLKRDDNNEIFVLCSQILHFLHMVLKLVAAVVHFTLIVLYLLPPAFTCMFAWLVCSLLVVLFVG